MREVLWIGIAGFLGANARWFLARGMAAWLGATFPWGTLVINVSGSFVLGLLMGLTEGHLVSPVLRLALGVGFLGAYTTFSTFTYETARLLETGSVLLATMNVAGSLLVGLVAVLVGLAAGRLL